MKLDRMILKLLIGMHLAFLCNGISAQTSRVDSEDCTDGITFNYLITDNLVAKDRRPSRRARYIYVFMDENAFSEENLKTLFTVLSRKYPAPQTLDIQVETHWQRVPIPSDCEGSGTSSNPDDGIDAHWSVYLRRGKDEIFRYNVELNDTDIKTVVVKGTAF